MQINSADKKTLQLIKNLDCYKTLAKTKEFRSIDIAFKKALRNNPNFLPDENLSNYLQINVRMNLIRFLEIKKNNEKVYAASFQLLMLLANYWPLNSTEERVDLSNPNKKFICPITYNNIEENNKAITVAGYLFTKNALVQHWTNHPSCIHPITATPVSRWEKEYILGIRARKIIEMQEYEDFKR